MVYGELGHLLMMDIFFVSSLAPFQVSWIPQTGGLDSPPARDGAERGRSTSRKRVGYLRASDAEGQGQGQVVVMQVLRQERTSWRCRMDMHVHTQTQACAVGAAWLYSRTRALCHWCASTSVPVNNMNCRSRGPPGHGTRLHSANSLLQLVFEKAGTVWVCRIPTVDSIRV